MNEDKRERLLGDPSDYGGRTLDDERQKTGDDEHTADGEPLNERGTADSAITDDARQTPEKTERDKAR